MSKNAKTLDPIPVPGGGWRCPVCKQYRKEEWNARYCCQDYPPDDSPIQQVFKRARTAKS